MITAIFIYDFKGDVLISKIYKDEIKRNIADVFRIQVINQVSLGRSLTREHRTPVLTLGSTSFIYTKLGNVWLCAVTRSNQDCATVLEFLYKLEALLGAVLWEENKKAKVKQDKLTLLDTSIVNQFLLCYNILGEVCDLGYPINLDMEYVKKYVPGMKDADSGGIFKNIQLRKSFTPSKAVMAAGSSFDAGAGSSTPSAHENITWRSANIKYRRNEIFVHVEEKLNVLFNSQGELLRSYVDGAIQLKTHLSGMPQCRFGFNPSTILLCDTDPDTDSKDNVVKLEDAKFHQCVQLSAFDSDRSIQFIPPDGDFQMMSYNCRHNINIPFRIYTQVREVGERIYYKIKVRSFFSPKTSSSNVIVKIPTPGGASLQSLSVSGGKAKFHPDENAFIWRLNKFYGDTEHLINAEVAIQPLSSSYTQWNRPSITLDFELDTYSSSGLAVRFLKIQEKANYKTVKWVRYKTRSGSYETRY